LNWFETVKLVPFSPQDMHALVADVASYPRFLPWVKAARLWDHQAEGTIAHFKGELLVGFKTFRAPFATTVASDPVAMTIETRLIRGPFRTLTCQWEFSGKNDAEPEKSEWRDVAQKRHADLDTASQIRVVIDYEFSDPLLRLLLSSNINKAVERLVGAFTTEAERRYAL
jgi:coenzyme Q-binding protein COQ10